MADVQSICRNWALQGRFLMTGRRPGRVGPPDVLVDQRNLIMAPSSEVMAMALAGRPNTRISHLYLGYVKSTGTPYVPPGLTPADTTFPVTTERGLVRVPLTFPGLLTPPDTGSDWLATFVFTVNSLTAFVAPGGPVLTGSTWLDEAGLVTATDPASSPANRTGDRVFARVRFTDVAHDDTYNLSISWGIKLIAPA
jgi:hypothetical protein